MRRDIRKVLGGLVFAGSTSLLTVVGSAASADQMASLRITIGEAVQDMKLAHEAIPYGVPESYSWQARPVIDAGNRPPPNFRAITGWGQIFSANGTAPVHLNVSLRNLRTYVLLTSGDLELIQSSSSFDGGQFNTDYKNNINTPAEIVSDADGNSSVTPNPFAAFHFWPAAGKVKFEPREVRGIIVTVEARINPKNGQTDADVNKKLVLSVGADYWLGTDSRWDNYRTNVGVALGRFRYVSTEWKCFTMTTITGDDSSILATKILC